MKTKGKSTWLGYMQATKSEFRECEKYEPADFKGFINGNSVVHSCFSHSIPMIYLLDYRNCLYTNAYGNFAGYKAECFLTGGLSHTLDIYQRDHLRLFNKQIFPDRLEILKDIPAEEHPNYIFSHNLCIRNVNGTYDHFLQRNCFMSDKAGNPLVSMGIILNINHYHFDNSVVQTVNKIDKEGQIEEGTFYKKVYYLHEEDRMFSKREREVLLWMADGLSSKMIADKLFVSEHTIINHRRNMQDKTHMPNAIALVSFAIKSGVI